MLITLSQLIPALSTVFVFVLGLVVLSKNVRSKTNILFSLFCFGTTAWLFGTFMMFGSKVKETAIFWDRFIYIAGILNPIFLYHFGRVFVGIKNRKWVLWLGYGLATFFLIISRTNYFVANLYKYSWGVHTQARVFHHFFLVYFIGFMLLFLIDVLRGMKNFTGIKKAQTKYIFIALLVMAIIGTPAFLPAYGIDIYPFAYLSGAIFAAIVAYAITRYQLMGIKLILRSTTVYLITFGVTIAFFLSLFLLLLRFLNFEIPWQVIILGVFLIMIIVLVFPIFLNFFRKLANKYFFASLHYSEVALEELTKKVPTIINLRQLLNLVCDTLKNCFHLNRIGILFYDPKTSNYQALVAEGFRPHNGLTLVRNNFLTQYLKIYKTPLAYQELDPILETVSASNKKKISAIKKLKFHMKKIEASVCCPLISQNKLIGILVLGPKISKEPYFKEDLIFLENLSYQVSIGLENARLYSEVKTFSKKLKKEVREATKELKKAYANLKKLDMAKTEFLSIASHQLRTPLTIVKGYVSMLLEEDYGEMPERAKRPLAGIFKSNERLIILVNDLLTVPKIEAGKIEMNFEKIDLSVLILGLIEEFQMEVKKKGIYLKLEKISSKMPEILIDNSKIRQALFNIIDNAIKYTNQGGITIKCAFESEKYKISIKDTGEGMTNKDAEKLFKSFSRGPAGIKLWTEGAGLGLYVAKKFVELHGGNVWVKSDGKGKGSTFYIELPIKRLAADTD